MTWSHAGHSSLFNPGWLFAHSGLAEERLPERVLWSAADLDEPPTFDGPTVMEDDEVLYRVLETVWVSGIARLRGLPAEPNTVEAFAARIGPIRETHFERVFNVLSRPDADSNAYTSDELAAHMDIPTRETPPGLQMLHCIAAEAKGGESVMVDGFRVGEDMRRMHPDAFANLTAMKWTYANRAGDLDYRWDTPHLILGENGELADVRLASFSRAPLIADLEKTGESYRALRIFLGMTYMDHYRMIFPFAAGDLVVFDNRRILHARKSFDPATGRRHLQGTYVDRDDHLSMMRTIRRRRDRQQAMKEEMA